MTSTKKIASNVLNYLHRQIPNFRMDETKLEALCFREKLGIHCKNDEYKKSVGNYSISVERVGPKAQEFLVNVFSSMTIDGCLGESKILSAVTEGFQFLEENRNEYFENNDAVYKNNLYLGIEESCYSVKTIHESPKENNKNSFDLAYENNYNLLSEGSNILLVRYLALNNFIGVLNLHFITIEGKIITCNYECLGMKHMRVNNTRNMDVYRIKQTTSNDNVYNENMICLTRKGRILKIHWSHTPYEIKINSLLDPLTTSQDPIIIPLPEIWKKDAELISKYIHKKMDEKDKQKSYLLLHPEIKNLVADYVNSLLSGKPEDVLTFTIEYFKTPVPTENLYDLSTEKESSTMTSKNTIETSDGKEFVLDKSIESLQCNCSCNGSLNDKSLSSKNSICDLFTKNKFQFCDDCFL